MRINNAKRTSDMPRRAERVNLEHLRLALSAILLGDPSEIVERVKAICEAAEDRERYSTLIRGLVAEYLWIIQ
jgi:hypothetical protein